jgi:hypothetical protein
MKLIIADQVTDPTERMSAACAVERGEVFFLGYENAPEKPATVYTQDLPDLLSKIETWAEGRGAELTELEESLRTGQARNGHNRKLTQDEREANERNFARGKYILCKLVH